MEDWHLLGKDLQDNWIIGDGNRVFFSRSVRRVANMSKEYLGCFQNFTADSWEYQQNFGGRIVPSKRLASMVGAQLSVPLPEVAEDDHDAKEALAFSRSFAGKVEEARDLVTKEAEVKEKKEKEKATELKPDEMAEEARVREDKRKTYEEEPIPELVPFGVDEDRNQAGPSTPRPAAQKMPAPSGSQEPDGKKLKQTVVKPVHDLEAESPASKRLKGEDTVERRLVGMTQVGEDVFYHLGQAVGQEEL